MRHLLLALLTLVLLAAPASAKNIFVAPKGDDATGNGAIGAPFATLRKAVSVAQAGDTVQMRAGHYTQHLYWDEGGDGAPNAWLTIRAYDGDRSVKIDGDPGATNTIDVVNRHYVRIIGLEVTATQPKQSYCLFVHGHSEHVDIQRGYFHDSNRGDAVKFSQSRYITIEDSEIARPGGDKPSGNNQGIDGGVDVDYGVFRNNYIHHFPDMAFYAKGGSQYTVAEGNVIAYQDPAWPGPATGFGQETDFEFMDGAVFQSYYMVMRNNIFANCPGGAVGTYSCYHAYFYNNLTYNCGDPAKDLGLICQRLTGDDYTQNTEGVYVFNNIFLDTRGKMPTVYRYHSGTYTGYRHDYNNYYNAGKPIPTAGLFDPNKEPHSTFGDPKLSLRGPIPTTYKAWVAYFRPTAASKLIINRGRPAGTLPFPGVVKDIEGRKRPHGKGWDIGPYEWGGWEATKTRR